MESKKNDKISTLEVESALINFLNVRMHVVVTNVSWGMFAGYSCERPAKFTQKHEYSREVDVFKVTPAKIGYEYEVKVSRQDLLKDFDKVHGHKHPLISYVSFVIPENLVSLAIEKLDPDFGIYKVVRNRIGRLVVVEVRKPKKNVSSRKLSDGEYFNLMRLGCMRIQTLKSQLVKAKKEIKELKNVIR